MGWNYALTEICMQNEKINFSIIQHFSELYTFVVMFNLRLAFWTNLQPPDIQFDSSLGRCLSGTYKHLDQIHVYLVCVGATFCALYVSLQFCDSW